MAAEGGDEVIFDTEIVNLSPKCKIEKMSWKSYNVYINWVALILKLIVLFVVRFSRELLEHA